MSWKFLLVRRVSGLTCLPQKRNTDSEIVEARSALPNSSRKQRILYGVVLRVEITCTRTASSSGPRAKPGKKFDVFIGEIVLDAMETFILMRFQSYAMARRRGINQAGQEGWES